MILNLIFICIFLCAFSTDKEIGCVETAHDSIVWTLAWHPLGHILCSGSNDHTIKFWTRNRPGDLMRDKYNLNTLPASLAALDDCEYDDAIIPGMGPEDKVEFTESLTADKGFIPGLELDPTANPAKEQEKKVPYSKPIPRNFQAQWAGSRRPEDVEEEIVYAPRERRTDSSGLTPQQVSENTIEGMLASGVLTTLDPQTIVGILVYGRFIRVHPDSRLMLAVRQGPDCLNKYIDAGKLEELRDVVPARERSRSMSPTLEGRESPPSKKSRFEPRQHHPQAVFVKELLSLKKPFLPCLLNMKQQLQQQQQQQQLPNDDIRNSPQANFNQQAGGGGNYTGPWANNNNGAWNNNANQNGFNNSNNNNNNNSNNNSNNFNSRNDSPSLLYNQTNSKGDVFPNNNNNNNNNNGNMGNSNQSSNNSNQNNNRRNRRGGTNNANRNDNNSGGGGGSGGRNRGSRNRRF